MSPSASSYRLAGRVAVVTGGTRGLGRAAVEALAEAGASVVFCARTEADVMELTGELRGRGLDVVGVDADVADLISVRGLAMVALDNFGGLDIWINNAGEAGPFGAMVDIPPERYASVIRTNVIGTWHGSLVALERFRASGRGTLVNVVGHGQRSAAPHESAHASSKAWVRSFSRSIAREHREISGVRVHTFDPGLIDTGIAREIEVIPGYRRYLGGVARRLQLTGQPPDALASRLAWLVSPAAEGRTGVEVRARGRVATAMAALGRMARGGEPPTLEVTEVPTTRRRGLPKKD